MRIPARPDATKISVFTKAVAVCVIVLLGYSDRLLAEEDRRHAGSHVHGAAILNMAVDGDQLIVEFASPAVNIVGFEHVASNENEVGLVAQALDRLEDHTSLFSLEGGGCVISSAIIEGVGLLPPDLRNEHAPAEVEASHRSFQGVYVFHCADVGTLKVIEVGCFDVWPGIDEIEAVFLGPDRQIAAELLPSSPRMELN